MIRGHDEAPIATIFAEEIKTYYKLLEKQQTFNTTWLVGFTTPTKDILRDWWQDPEKFRVRTDQAYKTEGLCKVYQLIAVMMSQLYGKGERDVFFGTWVPLMYVVATQGTIFNWVSILSSSLRTNIATAKSPPLEQPPEFYMSSYLLDVVCSRCYFEHWSCNWDTSVAQPIHCHYKVLWDTTYRSMLDVISETFIIQLYQILFGEESPCMSQKAMKTMVKVAH